MCSRDRDAEWFSALGRRASDLPKWYGCGLQIALMHNAPEREGIGHWMPEELANHGFDVSPGTLYPPLKRMEKNGWLISTADAARGPKAPRSYKITKDGREVLKIVRKQLRELGVEVGKH